MKWMEIEICSIKNLTLSKKISEIAWVQSKSDGVSILLQHDYYRELMGVVDWLAGSRMELLIVSYLKSLISCIFMGWKYPLAVANHKEWKSDPFSSSMSK